jgi:hypothetical protein
MFRSNLTGASSYERQIAKREYEEYESRPTIMRDPMDDGADSISNRRARRSSCHP